MTNLVIIIWKAQHASSYKNPAVHDLCESFIEHKVWIFIHPQITTIGQRDSWDVRADWVLAQVVSTLAREPQQTVQMKPRRRFTSTLYIPHTHESGACSLNMLLMCPDQHKMGCVLWRTRPLWSVKASPSETLLTWSAVVKCDGRAFGSFPGCVTRCFTLTSRFLPPRPVKVTTYATRCRHFLSFFRLFGRAKNLGICEAMRIVAVHPPETGSRRSIWRMFYDFPPESDSSPAELQYLWAGGGTEQHIHTILIIHWILNGDMFSLCATNSQLKEEATNRRQDEKRQRQSSKTWKP